MIVFSSKNVMQPDQAKAGASVRFVPRVGQGNDTPESQLWAQTAGPNPGINLVFQPTLNSGLQLCLDVEADSKVEGAPLVLRPCDGTLSQTWQSVGGPTPAFYRNQHSGFYMEVEPANGGRVVQRAFVPRVPSSATPQERQAAKARTDNQLFFLSPKSFGIGGA